MSSTMSSMINTPSTIEINTDETPEILYKTAIGHLNNKEYEKAIPLLEEAIKFNHTKSMFTLGKLYHLNDNISHNFIRAHALYEQAIEHGCTLSYNNCGIMFERGQGVKRDRKKAFLYFEKGVKVNNKISMYNLGVYYESGITVDKDINKAIELYKMSSDRGYINAIDHLAKTYKTYRSQYAQKDIIEYFHKINHIEKIKDIYDYDDYTISLIKENYELKQENQRLSHENSDLKLHVMSTPEGPLYFEALKDWQMNSGNS